MSRLTKKLLLILADVALLLCLAWLLGGNIVMDHSAERSGEGFLWNEVQYIPCTADHTEGRVIARTNGGWSIREVEEDETHTFLVLRSFLDQQLCVREDYEIPYGGVLSAVFWNGKKIEDGEFCAAVKEILETFQPERTYQTEAIFSLTDTQWMRDVSFCWNDCPVGVDREDCWLGMLEGEWVFAKKVSESGEERPLYSYAIYPIPEKHREALKTFSE